MNGGDGLEAEGRIKCLFRQNRERGTSHSSRTLMLTALEAAYTESCPPALLQMLDKVVLEDVDFDPDALNSSAFFEAGSSFWSVIKRRSTLRVVFKGCFIPDSVKELLSCSEKVTMSSK